MKVVATVDLDNFWDAQYEEKFSNRVRSEVEDEIRRMIRKTVKKDKTLMKIIKDSQTKILKRAKQSLEKALEG